MVLYCTFGVTVNTCSTDLYRTCTVQYAIRCMYMYMYCTVLQYMYSSIVANKYLNLLLYRYIIGVDVLYAIDKRTRKINVYPKIFEFGFCKPST